MDSYEGFTEKEIEIELHGLAVAHMKMKMESFNKGYICMLPPPGVQCAINSLTQKSGNTNAKRMEN